MNRDYLPKDKRLLPKEGEEQARLFSWTRMMARQYPELELLFHIPNGGSRTKAEAGRFKAEGVKAGVPDLFLPVARGEFHGLFIEMKRIDGGRVSEAEEVRRKESLSQIENLKEAINGSFPEGEVEITWESGTHVHIDKCVERG